MIKKLEKILKRMLIVGGLTLGGTSFYSGEIFNNPLNEDESSKISFLEESSPANEYIKLMSTNYLESLRDSTYSTSFERAKTEYEKYKQAELEEKLKIIEEEKRILREKRFPKPFYLNEDSLNTCIKRAYANIKKWPKEFDKRLFRLMLKQESKYNIYARSKTGYLGLGQQGYEVLETLRPEKFETFKDSITREIDSLAVEKFLFNPITNLELSLETLDYTYRFCAKHDPNWKQSNREIRRKKMLFCYNAGVGTAKDYNFNWNNKELPKENRDYPEIIMAAYHNPKIKVKI